MGHDIISLMPIDTSVVRDPRDIYYVCRKCERTAISFDKPFPEICAECRVVEFLTDGPGPPVILTPEQQAELDWMMVKYSDG